MPVQTAKAVLKNQSMRWSSPLLFNDPFDVPRQLTFGVTPERVSGELMKRVLKLIAHPPEDTSSLHKVLETVVKAVQMGFPEHLQAKLIAEFRENFASAASTPAHLDGFREYWTDILPKLRILCVTESPSHVAMWHHYADKYTGVVLEFSPTGHADSSFHHAARVRYSKAEPAFYGAKGWAEFLTIKPEIAAKKLFNEAIFTKSQDWSYESEWRLFTFTNGVETKELFSDYEFFKTELTGIYLGPSLLDNERLEILEMAGNYSEARVAAVSIGMSREFIFTKCY